MATQIIDNIARYPAVDYSAMAAYSAPSVDGNRQIHTAPEDGIVVPHWDRAGPGPGQSQLLVNSQLVLTLLRSYDDGMTFAYCWYPVKKGDTFELWAVGTAIKYYPFKKGF